MKDLARFVKEEFNKSELFENGVYVENLDDVKSVITRIIVGEQLKITFQSSHIKDHFISRLRGVHPDLNVINCNCTIDRFYENNFDGVIVFDNVKKCGHPEIIEVVKQYNGVIIC